MLGIFGGMFDTVSGSDENWKAEEERKDAIAFSCDRDKYGILVPYIPCGGKRALQSILDAGGFCSFEGMEYVQELGA